MLGAITGRRNNCCHAPQDIQLMPKHRVLGVKPQPRLERRGQDRPARNRVAQSFRQIRRFHRVINSDEVFGTHTYIGMAVAGFPNMFLITGPQSPSVFTNMVTSVEQHVDWIADCVAYLKANGRNAIEATAEAESRWVAHS